MAGILRLPDHGRLIVCTDLQGCLRDYDQIVSIFQRGAPLHDGAVVIVGPRIRAACAYLPLTTNPNLSRTFGTRHRAAIGITEESDAVAIVVSEERGTMSFCEGGRIEEDLDARALSDRLGGALASRRDTWWPFRRDAGQARPAGSAR